MSMVEEKGIDRVVDIMLEIGATINYNQSIYKTVPSGYTGITDFLEKRIYHIIGQ